MQDRITNKRDLVQHIKWIPPDKEWIRINTDGAAKRKGKAGCGGVIKDNYGMWKGGFSKKLGVCKAKISELGEYLED